MRDGVGGMGAWGVLRVVLMGRLGGLVPGAQMDESGDGTSGGRDPGHQA